jgi:hypothetical protein
MKNMRPIWIGFCVAFVTCAVVVGYLSKPRQAVEAKSNDIVGEWNVTISIPEGTFTGLIKITGDGVILGDEVPAPLEPTAHGNWINTGGNQASYTFLAIVGSANQIEIGIIKAIGTFQYDPETDSISGPFKVIQLDPNRPASLLIPSIRGSFEASQVELQPNVVFASEGTITGKRISVEPLK